ncbi:MAG: hypothetical protein ABIS18_10685 [Actinomycetota bacterium]
MVTGIKSRLAMFAMLGAFLIPISTSSLRGLTHALVCEENVGAPFTIILPPNGPPTILSSSKFTRDSEEGICGGLLVNFRAGHRTGEKVTLDVLITNNTIDPWRGTVQLVLVGKREATFPVQIGSISAGETRSDTLELSLPDGRTEIEGSLLLGP